MRRGGWILLFALVGALVIVLGARDRSADDDPPPTSTTQTQAVPDRQGLPAEAFETIALIRAGGPFPYSRDGVVFMNREGLLPEHERGYWHEYTVPTPGESDRGARRIITGRGGELYYTADHYRSFVRVKEPR